MKQPAPSADTVLASSMLSLIILRHAAALLHLHGDSFSFAFIYAPARFAVPIGASATCGTLHVADPLDACSPLRTNSSTGGREGLEASDRIVLIERGQCSFDSKVRAAQDAGFRAAIIFDDQDIGCLFSMIGDPMGIHIHAVFVSKKAGETLQHYANGEGECCIGPLVRENAGTVLVISFVSIVIMISAIATFLFARNCWILRNARHRKRPCMDKHEVEIIPHFTFKSAYMDNKCEIETCAICLEDYQDGQKLRLLPCRHDFHAACVDSWLTKWGTFCPICKFQLYG